MLLSLGLRLPSPTVGMELWKSTALPPLSASPSMAAFTAAPEQVESSGKGTIYSYTIIHRPPHPAFEPPFCAAIIALEEGWHMLSNVVGTDPATIAVGQAVAVEFLDCGEVTLPVFRRVN